MIEDIKIEEDIIVASGDTSMLGHYKKERAWLKERLEELPTVPTKLQNQYSVERYLKDGNMGYYIPDSMKVKEPSRISLVISRNKSEEQLKESLQESIKNEAKSDTSRIVLESIEISKQMTATVYAMDSSAFRILPLSRSQQYVNLQDTTETKWEWSVTPLKPGDHNLIIKASARVHDGETTDWVDIEVYNGIVPVKAVVVPKPSFSQRIIDSWKANWQWILPTLAAIGGFITWVVSAFGKKSQENKVVGKHQPKNTRRKSR